MTRRLQNVVGVYCLVFSAGATALTWTVTDVVARAVFFAWAMLTLACGVYVFASPDLFAPDEPTTTERLNRHE